MSGKINQGLLEVLNKAVKGKLEEYEIVMENNEMKGENFLGEIIFVSLKNKANEGDLFLVIKQSADFIKQMASFSDIYANEIRFYDEIWPVLHKFQEEYSIGFDKISRSFCSAIDDDKIGGKLVLEDLRQKQFRLHDKTVPLEEQHYRLIFKSYGMFHAISYAYHKRYPDQFNNLTNGLNGVEKVISLSERYNFQIRAQLGAVIALLDKKEDEDVRKMLEKELENDVLRHFVRNKWTSEDVVVLTHGDCWSNNFMFKYDENNELVDMRILDFQMVNPNSPVKDLSYVLYSGASKEVLDNLDYYLKIYHESFTGTLEKLKCNLERPFTFEKLKEEWRKHCMFGFKLGLYLWRVKFVVKNDLPNIEQETKTGNRLFVIAPDKMEDYKRAVLGLVSHMWENKFL